MVPLMRNSKSARRLATTHFSYMNWLKIETLSGVLRSSQPAMSSADELRRGVWQQGALQGYRVIIARTASKEKLEGREAKDLEMDRR